MNAKLRRQIAALDDMSVGQLREKYAELHGETTRSRHKQYLIRRIAWRLQARELGGLSERARKRAFELADIADIRVTAPKARPESPAPVSAGRDPRLPAPGNYIMRQYKGQTLRVLVQPDTFEYEGNEYDSLSAVAKAITGSHCNGFRFFKLEAK